MSETFLIGWSLSVAALWRRRIDFFVSLTVAFPKTAWKKNVRDMHGLLFTCLDERCKGVCGKDS